MFNYNEKLIIGFGGSPAALMKSGCTITTLIAVDRIFALYFPMKYYVLQRRRNLSPSPTTRLLSCALVPAAETPEIRLAWARYRYWAAARDSKV
uniref:G-protein coupled receptors family 3 profile domain-containing protein n=1 Tax=Ascaris lumbricoides TaxID=6252 RepID=A0A9J2Q058_ASCLU